MFEEIKFEPGKVVFDDFKINLGVPLFEQMELLKEDLFQVDYSGKYIIDVGWYPSFQESGNFKISVVEDYVWEKPLFVKKCNDLNKLKEYMWESVNLITELTMRE